MNASTFATWLTADSNADPTSLIDALGMSDNDARLAVRMEMLVAKQFGTPSPEALLTKLSWLAQQVG